MRWMRCSSACTKSRRRWKTARASAMSAGAAAEHNVPSIQVWRAVNLSPHPRRCAEAPFLLECKNRFLLARQKKMGLERLMQEDADHSASSFSAVGDRVVAMQLCDLCISGSGARGRGNAKLVRRKQKDAAKDYNGFSFGHPKPFSFCTKRKAGLGNGFFCQRLL